MFRTLASSTSTRRTNLGYQLGLMGSVRLLTLARLARYVMDIHPRYALRVLLVVNASICSLPLRLLEAIRYRRQIASVRIDKPPVFIVGHWRSGTTHLHNLMSQDRDFGYLSMYQAAVPDCSLVGRPWLKALLSRIVPVARPMDNMIWPMDAPQEEEIALGKVIPYSFYTRFLFPRKAPQLFSKYVLLEGAGRSAAAELKRKYYRLLQVATIHAGGRRLLLKNPVNTARVRLLLELFPGARFVHAYRCPYDVFASTSHLHRKMFAVTALQLIRPEDDREAILTVYENMLRRFFAERSLIPENHLVEVRFEDLENDPLRELRRVYETLELPGYREAEPAFRAYIDSQRAYVKNRLELSADDREQIERRWSFAFAELGYGVACNGPRSCDSIPPDHGTSPDGAPDR